MHAVSTPAALFNTSEHPDVLNTGLWSSSAELCKTRQRIRHSEPFVFFSSFCRFILKAVAAPLRLTGIQSLSRIASVLFTVWREKKKRSKKPNKPSEPHWKKFCPEMIRDASEKIVTYRRRWTRHPHFCLNLENNEQLPSFYWLGGPLGALAASFHHN